MLVFNWTQGKKVKESFHANQNQHKIGKINVICKRAIISSQ